MNMYHSLLALHFYSKTLEATKSYEALAYSFVGSVLVYSWYCMSCTHDNTSVGQVWERVHLEQAS